MPGPWLPRAIALASRAGLRGLGRGLLVAVVLGVIAMHHVVGAHSHGATGAAHSAAPTPVASPAPAPAPAASHHPGLPDPPIAAAPDAGAPASAASTRASALLAGDGAETGTGVAMLLHLCLAVLAGLVTLAALALARGWRGAGPDRRGGPTVVAVAASPRAPPPLPVRLAQLQVLRL